MVIVFISSLLVALTWQFAQFVFLLQGFTLFGLQVMSIASTSKVRIIIFTLPYSGKFSEINIFGNYNEICISEIKFQNFVYLPNTFILQKLVNYPGTDFSEIKFQKVNEISEILKIFISKNFPLYSM